MTKTPRNLPPYSGDLAVCIKCGAGSSHHGPGARHYVEWVPPNSYTARGNFGECLERRCQTCGYTWPEAVVKAVIIDETR